MGKKIFFIDLDGTLMNDDKTISEENRNALRQMVDTGNYIALATGRAISSARKIAKELGLTRPGCYLVAYNGAIVYDCAADCVLSNKKLPIEYEEYLYNEAHEAGIYIQTYSDTQVLAQAHTKELDFYIKKTKMPYRIEKDMWSILNEEPPKMILIDLEDKHRLETFQQEHMEWQNGKCTSFFSCPEYLEYCPLGATKGFGVNFLCEFLKIPHENTIAIGDQENDIPMIQAAYVGVAMKNADQKVKDYADYVSEQDNNHSGVAGVIKRFG
jgi:hypothetical protein